MGWFQNSPGGRYRHKSWKSDDSSEKERKGREERRFFSSSFSGDPVRPVGGRAHLSRPTIHHSTHLLMTKCLPSPSNATSPYNLDTLRGRGRTSTLHRGQRMAKSPWHETGSLLQQHDSCAEGRCSGCLRAGPLDDALTEELLRRSSYGKLCSTGPFPPPVRIHPLSTTHHPARSHGRPACADP